MSDDFIPLNQSTPVRKNWFQGANTSFNHNNSGFQNNMSFRGKKRKGRKGRGNHSQCFSNDSNNSFGQNKNNIDAYLHPSMLQDPWAKFKQKTDISNSPTE